jgi:hypothetical protein
MIQFSTVPAAGSAGQTSPSATPFVGPHLTVSNAVMYSGLCRSTIYELIRGRSPLVESISVANPARTNPKRGKRLVIRESLDAYLHGLRNPEHVEQMTPVSSRQQAASSESEPTLPVVTQHAIQAASSEFQHCWSVVLACLTKASNDLPLEEFDLFCKLLPTVIQQKAQPESAEVVRVKNELQSTDTARTFGRIVAETHDAPSCPPVEDRPDQSAHSRRARHARPQAFAPAPQRRQLPGEQATA